MNSDGLKWSSWRHEPSWVMLVWFVAMRFLAGLLVNALPPMHFNVINANSMCTMWLCASMRFRNVRLISKRGDMNVLRHVFQCMCQPSAQCCGVNAFLSMCVMCVVILVQAAVRRSGQAF